MQDIILPILKEFGFPIALCVVLILAIRHQNAQLVKAYTDRISTLEKIVRDLSTKVNELEQDRLRRADEYAHSLKALALQWSSLVKEVHSTVTGMLVVTRKLCDSINVRPCMQDYPPQDPHPPRPPSSAEVPTDPAKVETSRIFKHG